MATMQDLVSLIQAYQKQRRQGDGAPPFERAPMFGKAGTPFSQTKIPGAPQSVTVGIPPFNGIGDVNVMDVPGAAEGSVVAGGRVTPTETYEEGIARTLEPNMADRVRREMAQREATAPTPRGQRGDRTRAIQPERYGPGNEDITPPVMPTGDESSAPFLNTLASTYTPAPLESPRQSEVPEEEGMFSRASRNPLFLTGMGMLANAKKGPFEAGGIAALNAASALNQNRRYEADRKLQERRLTADETRFANQDAYNRQRNELMDKRLDRDFEYKKLMDERAQETNQRLIRNQDLNRSVLLQQQVEKEIDSQRDAIASSGDLKALQEFNKNLPEIRRRLYAEKSAYLRLMTPGVGISFQDLAAGPGGGIR